MRWRSVAVPRACSRGLLAGVAAGPATRCGGHLATLGLADAAAHNFHDFRRGAARDLAANGGALKQLLDAGEWLSPAFLKYLNTEELEKTVALQACLDDLEGED